MVSISNAGYLSNREWFESVVGGKDLVLRYTSALECLNLFLGYGNEKRIYVYAKQSGEYENVDYRIVNTFDDIEIVRFNNVLCTSVDQTINDMLGDFDNIDEQSLLEALSDYYFEHNKSFDGLVIRSENKKLFNTVKNWAIEYHSVG